MDNEADPYCEFRALEREFYKIDEDVIDRIRKHKPLFMKYAAKALDSMFDHLRAHPMVADYFADDDNLEFLRSGMLAHCDTVLAARFDAHHYEESKQIGLRHSKLDYPSFVYSAAYTNMLMSIKRQAREERNSIGEADLEALDRMAFYDLELTQTAFFQNQIEKASALNADTAKVRALFNEQSDAA